MSKSKKRTRISRRRKIRGGCGCAQGNGIFKGGFPSENVIPLNSYVNDPTYMSLSERLTGGGKRKKRKSRKKKGGSSFSNFFNPLSYTSIHSPSDQPGITNYYGSNVPQI
jgi:hypothetical protein